MSAASAQEPSFFAAAQYDDDLPRSGRQPYAVTFSSWLESAQGRAENLRQAATARRRRPPRRRALFMFQSAQIHGKTVPLHTVLELSGLLQGPLSHHVDWHVTNIRPHAEFHRGLRACNRRL